MCTCANALMLPDFWEGKRLCITSEFCTQAEGFPWGILSGRSCRAPTRPVGEGRDCWDSHKPALHCHPSLLLSTSQLRERETASCLLLGMVRGGLPVFQAPSETRRVQGDYRLPCMEASLEAHRDQTHPLNKLCLFDAPDCYCKLQR